MTPTAGGMDEKLGRGVLAMATRRTLLVTGFEPFGGHATNVSAEVARALAAHPSVLDPWTNEIHPLEVTVDVLPVDEKGALKTAARWRAGERWDAVLHLGLCESCTGPRVERMARDRLDMRIPDNRGRQCTEQHLDGSGPRGCWIDPLSPNPHGLPHAGSVSMDAGAFVCNETYFHTLTAIDDTVDPSPVNPPALFVHLPHESRLRAEDALDFVASLLPWLLFPYPPQGVHVVAAAVVNGAGDYLVTRRKTGEGDGGLWEFPGGKCEPGESWRSALKRELREELELEVEPQRLLGTFHRERDGTTYVIHLAGARLPEGESLPSLKVHDAWAWVNAEQGQSLSWSGRDDEMHALLTALSHNQVDASPSSSIARSS